MEVYWPLPVSRAVSIRPSRSGVGGLVAKVCLVGCPKLLAFSR